MIGTLSGLAVFAAVVTLTPFVGQGDRQVELVGIAVIGALTG